MKIQFEYKGRKVVCEKIHDTLLNEMGWRAVINGWTTKIFKKRLDAQETAKAIIDAEEAAQL